MPIIPIEINGELKTPKIDPSCWISDSAWLIGDVTMGAENVVKNQQEKP
ncbi:MAG: hypothetical protein ACFFA3_12505 [Promethearchaeota archaeon]